MGRELFDFAFKTYANRWAFKHPTPADLFRTMEDASGEDLDWFWRGWFYGIDPVDISIDSLKAFNFDAATNKLPPMMNRGNNDMKLAKPLVPAFDDISKVRNRADKNIQFLTDADPSLRDFYWRYDRGLEPYDSTYTIKTEPMNSALELPDNTELQKYANAHLYEVYFSNKGGLVMPIIIQWTFKDGTTETDRIPAQIWRKNEQHVSKLFLKNKEVVSVLLDPMKETADINEDNNAWPQINQPTNFNIFKMKQMARGQSQGMNPMQKATQK